MRRNADTILRARRLAETLADEPTRGGGAEAVQRVCDELEVERRRLVRLGLDLHDGPLQQLAALGADVHLFRSQIVAVARDAAVAARLLGRVDDVSARLTAVEVELRELASLAGASALLHGPLSRALAELIAKHRGACAVLVDLESDVDEVPLDDAARITLLRVVQAAVANAGRHSGSATALVRIRHREGAVSAEVADGGRGFDVDETLRRAVADRRLGLIGMRERVAMLGGTLRIESRPGEGTRIKVEIPAGPRERPSDRPRTDH